MILLEAHGLAIGYHSPLQKELDFKLSQGEVLFISGPNGSGKSTLLKTVLGVLNPLSGVLKNHSDARNTDLLPQLSENELPLSITLGEMVESFGIDPDNFSFLGSEFFAKKWDQASGGERQKTLILTRLGSACDLLILDEPFNHIDKQGVEDISLFLSGLLKRGLVGALIIVSHLSPDREIFAKVRHLGLQ